jgi:crotonobetainyl-CoA hydratase
MTIHRRISEDGTILEIVLDRPKANALDAATSRQLGATFVEFMNDPTQRVAIFTGAGERFFSAGWDLNAANDGEAFDSDYGPGGFGGFPDLPNRTKPIIAAVNGMAIGGGWEIAMAADLIVAAEHATFALPETTLGILPDAGSVRLPRLLPRHVANEILFAGRRLSAQEAQRFGLVNEVTSSDTLMSTAYDLARRVVRSAPLSVTAVLDIARQSETMSVADAMAAVRHNEAYRAAIDSLDASEGPRAFAEKRDPKWQGR